MAKTLGEENSEPHNSSNPSEVQHDTTNIDPTTKLENGKNTDNNGVIETLDKSEVQTPTPLHSIFSSNMKMFLVLMTVFSTIFSPLSSFMYLPAITPIAESYHRSLGEINLTVTIYQIMQAVSPLFFGDLSDQIGRRLVYMLTFTIYIAANIGLALQNNYAALMVLRALQSTGSSATVAIGSAVMADVTTSAERGGYITAVQASVMFAPALAPVLGGILTQFLGWRSTFWFLVIAAGVFLLVYVPFVPEVSWRVAEIWNGSLTDIDTDCSKYCWQRIHPSTKTKHFSIYDVSTTSETPKPRVKFRTIDSPQTESSSQKDPHPQYLGSNRHHFRKRRRFPDVLHVSLRHGQLRNARSTPRRNPSPIQLQRSPSRAMLHPIRNRLYLRLSDRRQIAELEFRTSREEYRHVGGSEEGE